MDPGFTEFDLSLRGGRRVHIRAMRRSDEAEFLSDYATTVSTEYGGLGPASALIAATNQRGLHVMEDFVLAQNQPMLKVAVCAGFKPASAQTGSGGCR